MGKQERKLKRRVEKGIEFLEHMEKTGPEGLAERCRKLREEVESYDSVYVQYDILGTGIKSIWDDVKPWIKKLHTALSEAVGKETGMTLEDFLWIRDFAPLDVDEDEREEI